MSAVRRLLAQRRFAIWLCAASLLFKLLVPAGTMIGVDHGRLAIQLCSGIAARPMAPPGMTMPGMAMPDAAQAAPDPAGHPTGHDRPDQPCAFAGLAAVATGAVDAVLLAACLLFVLRMALRPMALPAALAPAYLRPPLRGPPARR